MRARTIVFSFRFGTVEEDRATVDTELTFLKNGTAQELPLGSHPSPAYSTQETTKNDRSSLPYYH